MMSNLIEWRAGDPAARSEVERVLDRGLDSTGLLKESAHRSVHLIAPSTQSELPPDTGPLVFKIHRTATGRHPLREAMKRRIARTAAHREWLALESLHAAGVAVPRPRGWGHLRSGDEIVVTDFLDGQPLRDHFHQVSADSRQELVKAMAQTIGQLHASGHRHGDLHLGNIWIAGERIFLLDLERSRPLRNTRERLFDLARLEFSLAKAGWNSDLRHQLRAALDVDEHFDFVLRRFLRDHLRGRARRVLRIGRNWSHARLGQNEGLRETSLDEQTLAALIEAAERDPHPRQRREGRIRITEAKAKDVVAIVKRVDSGGFRRALAERLRGSSAARAFHAGQRFSLVSRSAARPLAYLEQRRFGIPTRSWLVVEKVGDEDLDQFVPGRSGDAGLAEAEDRFATALGAWLADLHASGLSHRDFKAGNVRIAIRGEAIHFWLVDLEDLIGPRKLSDESRRNALVQLNASLSDDAFGLDSRRRALKLYLSRGRFPKIGWSQIAADITRRSLARKHRWRARGCDLADRD